MIRSDDGGLTWGPPVRLSETVLQRGSPGGIATDGAGVWIVVWFHDLVFAARSVDDGLTWESPVELSGPTSFSRFPAIATDGNGTWVAAFESFEDLGGTIGNDLDILFVRSTDNGLTWEPRAVLDTTASGDVDPDTDVALATDGGGTWVATWTSGEDVLVSQSVDDGAMWGAPVTVSGIASAQRFSPSVTTDGSGNWIVGWGEVEDGDSDAVEARSSDGAATWSDPACISPGCTVDAYQSFAPIVGARAGGGWLAAWLVDAGGHRDAAIARTGVSCSTDANCRPCEVCSGDGTCAIGPRLGCLQATAPGKGNIRIRDRATSSKDALIWTLTKGEATSLADLGDPTTADGYTFCLFDQSGTASDLLFVADLSAGGTCGTPACWRSTATGYRYWDGSKPSPAGIRSALLKSGSAGRAKFIVKGKGDFLQERLLGLPVPPLPAPLRAQLQAATGACWDTTFSATQQNGGGSFKARAE